MIFLIFTRGEQMKTVNPYSAEHPVPPEKFAGQILQVGAFNRFITDTIDGNSKNYINNRYAVISVIFRSLWVAQ